MGEGDSPEGRRRTSGRGRVLESGELLGEGRSPSTTISVGVGGRIPGVLGGVGIGSDAIRLIRVQGVVCAGTLVQETAL